MASAEKDPSALGSRSNQVDSNGLGTPSGGIVVGPGSNVHANTISFNDQFGSAANAGLMIPCTSGYTNNTISGNAPSPDVVLLGCAGSVTGGAGNNCSGAACP